MSNYLKRITIKRGWIIFFILLIITVIFIALSYIIGITEYLGVISGSIAAGLVVTLVQLIIEWDHQREMDKLKELHLEKIMYDRDQRDEYAAIIRSSQEKIDLMGVTALRFFSHFADLNKEARTDAKVLLDALARGVAVRILLPQKDYITETKKNDCDKVKEHICKITDEISNVSIQIKYFDHIPAHSIFRVDDECIIGPVFPDVESKYTPALRLKNKSRYTKLYLDYFESEWNKANE